MKKVILSAAAALVLLASCGKSEVCECIDTAANVMKESKEAKGDMTKIKALQEKYKSQEDKCKKVFEKKSDADMKKMEEEAKKCDGYAEMEKMRKEGM
jgi:ElaB/YqjD/DUF883 family membrane-anchored ribosome-binding protein